MSLTDYSSKTQLLNLLGSTMSTPTWPSQWFVGVSTTVPTFAKGASAPYWNFTEPADTAYARVLATFQALATQPSSAYAMQPTSGITFPTAAANWGPVVWMGLWDAQTAGNLWFIQPLARVANDASTTSGSTTIDSASIDFTSADVGQLVIVSGVPIGATIASITSTTAAVMTAEANVTASGLTLAIPTPVTVSSADVLTLAQANVLIQVQ